MSSGEVDGHPRDVWWNADGETIVESYTITDMAHGTPLGVTGSDEPYGAEGAFLIEAGISSSYHIANFFGLTERVRKPKAAQTIAPKNASKAAAKAAPTGVSRERAGTIAMTVPVPAPEPVWSGPGRRRGIDVGAVITRALTAAGLMK